MTIEDLGDKLEFPGMTGTYLYKLWRYHKRVRKGLGSCVIEFRSSGLPDDMKGLLCIGRRYRNHSFPQWLDDYIKSIASSPHLFDLIVFENARACHIKNETWGTATCSCADISSQVIRTFWEALTAVVHGTIEKVRKAGVTGPHCDN
jgi:hypothetical protein